MSDLKTTIPTIAEQLIDPTGLETESRRLRALIDKYPTLGFERVHVTQRMALAMLSLNIGNRRLSRTWIQRLRRILLEGRYKENSPQVPSFDTNGYLRDGQHRLLAIAETGVAVAIWVAFGVDPDVFPTLDVGIRRSGAQFLELSGIKNSSHVQAFVRLRHRLATGGEKLDDHGVYVAGLELSANSDLLQKAIAAGYRMQSLAPVSAAAFAFWRITTDSPDRERLGKFWDQLVEGYELGRGDPILEVRRLLDRNKNSPKKLHQSLQQTTTVDWITWAWNEWVQGRSGGKPPVLAKAKPHSVRKVLGAPT